MNLQDLRLYILNALTFAISTTNIEFALRIVLVLVSIGYTAQRWWELSKEKKDDK
jgi:hypothetical protein